MKICITGSHGFIGGYVVEELLTQNFEVIGIDNFSKYGQICKSFESNDKFKFYNFDIKNTHKLYELISDCDHFIAGAAMIGGISYFHEYAYDLLAENERILASSFDAAIKAFKNNKLKKITVISSSMVYENSKLFPTPEGSELKSPPPFSTYGFQKLSSEYFCKGALQQYGLPYTIIRPFNCVGTGEYQANKKHEIYSGNVKLALSHVVPDFIVKAIMKQQPFHILGDGSQTRCFTFGGDIAKGIVKTLENKKAINNDFNISIGEETKIEDLAKMIWNKVNPDLPIEIKHEKQFDYDVQKRVPDVRKAKELLDFTATTKLEPVVDNLIDWIKNNYQINQ